MQWVLFLKSHEIYNKFVYSHLSLGPYFFNSWISLWFQPSSAPVTLKTLHILNSLKSCATQVTWNVFFFFDKLFILQDATQFYLLWSHLWFTLLFLLLWLNNTLIITLFKHVLIFTIVTTYMCISIAGLWLAPCLAHFQ